MARGYDGMGTCHVMSLRTLRHAKKMLIWAQTNEGDPAVDRVGDGCLQSTVAPVSTDARF